MRLPFLQFCVLFISVFPLRFTILFIHVCKINTMITCNTNFYYYQELDLAYVALKYQLQCKDLVYRRSEYSRFPLR